MKTRKNPMWDKLCSRLSDLDSMEEAAQDVLRKIQEMKDEMEEYYDKVVSGEYDKKIDALSEKDEELYGATRNLEDRFDEMDELVSDLKNGVYF